MTQEGATCITCGALFGSKEIDRYVGVEQIVRRHPECLAACLSCYVMHLTRMKLGESAS